MTDALSQLASMASECSEQGWDGDAASGIDPIALSLAEQFLRALPDDIPPPDFAPEPDGSVSVDWIPLPRRMLSLSIGRSSRLAYAWLDGSDTGHGVAPFDGQSVPLVVLNLIRSLVGQAQPDSRPS